MGAVDACGCASVILGLLPMQIERFGWGVRLGSNRENLFRGSFLAPSTVAGWFNGRRFIGLSRPHCSTTGAVVTRRRAEMLLSINQISELTGQDRRTIVKRLEDLPFQPRDKNACLYSSTEALPAVYAMAFAVERGSRLREVIT